MRRQVLATVLRNPALRRLATGYAVFSMAEHGTWIAILVWAYAGGGATEAGLLAVAMLIPAAVVAPLASTAADRFPRERVLVAAYLVQALAMGIVAGVLLGGAPRLAVYIAAVLASTSIVLTRPTQGAIIPQLARTPGELTAANVLAGTIEGLAILIGPAVAGLVMAFVSTGAVFLLFAILLGAVGILMFGLVAQPGSASPPAGQVAARTNLGPAEVDPGLPVLAGFRTLAEQPGPRLVVIVVASAWVLWGAVDIFSVMLAIDLLGLGQGGAGFIVSAIGAGGLIGSLGGLALVGRRRLTTPLLAGLALWGLPLAAIGLLPQTLLAFVFVAIAGAERSILDAAGRTLLQRVSSDDTLASIFGVLEGLQMGALAVGSVGAPLLVAMLGARGALVAAGLVLPIIALLAWRGMRAIDTGVVAPEAWIAALRAVPMFTPLAPAVIEQLAAGATAWTAEPGTTLVAEGDPGDRFHLVRSGQVEVTIAGRLVRTLGPGEFFGEIALLRDIPRTATVRAITGVELLSLAREPFLLALTGHRSSRRVAEGIADSLLTGTGPA